MVLRHYCRKLSPGPTLLFPTASASLGNHSRHLPCNSCYSFKSLAFTIRPQNEARFELNKLMHQLNILQYLSDRSLPTRAFLCRTPTEVSSTSMDFMATGSVEERRRPWESREVKSWLNHEKTLQYTRQYRCKIPMACKKLIYLRRWLLQDFTEQQPFIKLVDEMALKDSFLLPQQLCKHFCVERPQARAIHGRLIEYGCYGMNKLQSLIPITQNWLAKTLQVFFTQVSRHHGNPLLKLTYIAPESNHGFFQNGFCFGKPTQPCHLEHLEPMSAMHLEEEPSSRKSKPWRLFQSLTCVIVTSNASELPWDDGDNKTI